MKHKINILNVYDKNGLSGVERVLSGIKDLRKLKGIDFRIYTMCLRNVEEVEKTDSRYDYYFNSSSKFNLKSFFKLKFIIKKYDISILHSHQGKSLIFSLVYKMFFDKNIKIIQHEHAEIFQDNFFYKLILNLFHSKIDLILPVSEAIKTELVNKTKVPKYKIKVFYNFVDLLKFNRKNITKDVSFERAKIGLKKDDFVIGFAGRLIERKGWKEFVLAAKILQKKYPKIKFIIVGDGEDRDEMLSLIKKSSLKETMIYLGYTSDMIWFYSLLDCFVISSHWEGMPMAQLEALAFGVSVISSDGAGLNEVGKDAFDIVYFPNKKYRALAQKIKNIYNDKVLRKNLVVNARKTTKNFSLEKYLLNLNELYNDFTTEKS